MEIALNEGTYSIQAPQPEAVAGFGGGTLFWRPFTYPGSLELLYRAQNGEAGISGDVIYEYNGIHYINSHIFNYAREQELDRNFSELVDSVVNQPNGACSATVKST